MALQGLDCGQGQLALAPVPASPSLGTVMPTPEQMFGTAALHLLSGARGSTRHSDQDKLPCAQVRPHVSALGLVPWSLWPRRAGGLPSPCAPEQVGAGLSSGRRRLGGGVDKGWWGAGAVPQAGPLSSDLLGT